MAQKMMQQLVAAESLLASKRYDDVRRLMAEALAEEPDAAEPHVMIARAAMAERDYRQAMQSLRRAIKADPQISDAYVIAGMCTLADVDRIDGVGLVDPHSPHSFIRRSKQAQRFAERALEIDPEHVDAIGLLAWAQNSQGKHAVAEATARRGLAIDPQHTYCLDALHAAQEQRGQDRQAENTARDRLALDVESAHGHAQLANQLLEQGQREEAQRHAAEALRLEPTDADFEALYWRTVQPPGVLGKIVGGTHRTLVRSRRAILRPIQRHPSLETFVWVVMFGGPLFLAMVSLMQWRQGSWDPVLAGGVLAAVAAWLFALCGASISGLAMQGLLLLGNPQRREAVFRPGWWITPLIVVAAVSFGAAIAAARWLDNPWLILAPLGLPVALMPAAAGVWMFDGLLRGSLIVLTLVACVLMGLAIYFWAIGELNKAQGFGVFGAFVAIGGSMGLSYVFVLVRNHRDNRLP